MTNNGRPISGASVADIKLEKEPTLFKVIFEKGLKFLSAHIEHVIWCGLAIVAVSGGRAYVKYDMAEKLSRTIRLDSLCKEGFNRACETLEGECMYEFDRCLKKPLSDEGCKICKPHWKSQGSPYEMPPSAKEERGFFR